MSNSALLHVIIVNYFSSTDLRNCLRSLSLVSLSSVTVVENGSGQEEFEIVKFLCTAERVQLIRSDRNLGFGGGVNLGVASLPNPQQTDVIWILNPDTVVNARAAELLMARASCGNTIVSPVIEWGDTGDIWFAGGHLDLARGKSYHHHVTGAPSNFLTGASLVMGIDVWESLGGFREDLFLYWEDADLSLRATVLNIDLVVLESAVIWHRVGGSGATRSGRSAAYYYFMSRNRILVSGRYHRRVGVAFGRGLPETVRLVYWSARERDGRARKVASVFRGLIAGIVGRK